MTANSTTERWTSALPDVTAFAAVLGLAWWTRASATDLVWSLWLSSLVVGYAIILWTILRPAVIAAAIAWRDRALVEQAIEHDPRSALLVAGIGLLVGVFMVAFFTVHFLGFHYVHSEFLSAFFPLGGGDFAGTRAPQLHGRALFVVVLRRYWVFLPSAFLAERSAFLGRPAPAVADTSVTAEAIAARKAALFTTPAGGMMLPYQKVVRMHLLIFFFAFAHFAGLDNFAVYAVVYAVYFFPWRLLSRSAPAAPSADSYEPTAKVHG